MAPTSSSSTRRRESSNTSLSTSSSATNNATISTSSRSSTLSGSNPRRATNVSSERDPLSPSAITNKSRSTVNRSSPRSSSNSPSVSPNSSGVSRSTIVKASAASSNKVSNSTSNSSINSTRRLTSTNTASAPRSSMSGGVGANRTAAPASKKTTTSTKKPVVQDSDDEDASDQDDSLGKGDSSRDSFDPDSTTAPNKRSKHPTTTKQSSTSSNKPRPTSTLSSHFQPNKSSMKQQQQLGSSTGNSAAGSKSVSINPNQPGPSHLNSSITNPNQLGSSVSTAGTGKVSALARSRVTLAPGDMSLAAGMLGNSERPINVDSTSFEEWMKMATDNKINATNTWSFALIDYFHDMSLLRSDSGDGTINFTKASCTLDGCVKVWTSRVDSVVVETGKLLSGLRDEVNAATRKAGGEEAGSDDEDVDGDEDRQRFDGMSSGPNGKRKKSKKDKKEATLAKNFNAIATKKLDLEFTVDPLFKKTSADFDEGGAGGLLMNHLGVDSKVRVVFDAGDGAAVAEDKEADEREKGMDQNAEIDTQAEEGMNEEQNPNSQTVANDLVDLTRLRSKLFGIGEESGPFFTDSFDSQPTITSLLQSRSICPTLGSFRFSKDDNTLFGAEMDDVMDQEHGTVADWAEQAAGSGFESGRRAVSGASWDSNMDAGLDFQDMGGDMPALDDYPDDFDGGDFQADGGVDFFDGGDDGPMDNDFGNGARPAQRDLFAALHVPSGPGDEEEDPEVNQGVFDYFDQKVMKNWAGPEHWKMNKRVGAFGGIDSKKKDDEPASSGSKKRATKESTLIDFESESTVTAKELFEAPRSETSILLPKANRKSDPHLLPEDHHFSSKMLLRYFLKPRAKLPIRRRKVRTEAVQLDEEAAMERGNEIDEQFWAQAASRPAGQMLMGMEDDDDEGNGDAAPFDPQFFHDDGVDHFDGGDMPPLDGDGFGFPEAEMDVDDEEMEQATQAAITRVRPEFVNYAKKAKRVDVKKLKETIWKELGIERKENDAESTDEEDGPATPSGSPPTSRTFNTVLSGLRRSYPKDRMEEISTSFCFICLLHLANEEGLKLDTNLAIEKARAKDAARLKLKAKARGSIAPEAEEELGDLYQSMRKKGLPIGQDDDDDRLGAPDDDEDEIDEIDNDELHIGKLELLNIVKDLSAGRSA